MRLILQKIIFNEFLSGDSSFVWDKIDLWFTDFYVIIFIIIYIIACL